MNNIYIDESGSMTIEHKETHPYFVVAIVKTDNPDKLRRIHKRFVSKHIDELRSLDKYNKMFLNGKFKELKGNEFSPDMKRNFINYFCQGNQFSVFYIVAYNNRIQSSSFYKNTARAFNYLLKIALEFFVKHGLMDNTGFAIQLDERNERTDSTRFLQDYLNTELLLDEITAAESTVTYFDSANNKLIQVADVFANIYFSQLMTGKYTDDIDRLKSEGYIKKIFNFPL